MRRTATDTQVSVVVRVEKSAAVAVGCYQLLDHLMLCQVRGPVRGKTGRGAVNK